MTDAFAVEVAAPIFEIGHFELRGFRQHQSVYGLCQEGQVPSNPKRPISYLIDRSMPTNDAVDAVPSATVVADRFNVR
jgi:hypothetical protein